MSTIRAIPSGKDGRLPLPIRAFTPVFDGLRGEGVG